MRKVRMKIVAADAEKLALSEQNKYERAANGQVNCMIIEGLNDNPAPENDGKMLLILIAESWEEANAAFEKFMAE